MQMLPSKGGKTPAEQVTSWAIPIGIGILVFAFWGKIVPFVLNTVQNTAWLVFYAALLYLFFFHIVPNWPMVVRKITSWFIKMDPLSFMDRYVDILIKKLANVRRAIVSIKGAKIELEGQMREDEKVYKDRMRLAQAAKEQGNINRASGFAMEAQGAKESIELMKPSWERAKRSLEFMEPMAENWEISIESLKSLIERKRRDWRILKKNAAALNQAEEFLSGNTPEARIFFESNRVLEEQMAEKMAYIEDFETRAKPIMEGAQIKKMADQKEAMEALEEYMSSDKLFLPDFSQSSKELVLEPVQQNGKVKYSFNKTKS